ncbi:MAG: TetR family transcriptional regulator [Caulobacteraceae bacterium]|nr:TetR family transcriptional regulator [Caulobacteraceae bacterium]
MRQAGATERGGADTAAAGRMALAAAALWRRDGPAAVTFGAVADESGLAKSLVSHHFATREQLLEAAAAALAAGFEQDLDRLADQLAKLPSELACPEEVAALVVEALATSPSDLGAGLLELVSLGLTAPGYRDLFVRLAARIRGLLPQRAFAANQAFLMAFVLGELLGHCPQHAGAVGLAGLRRRVGWFVEETPSDEQRWLSGLLSIVRAQDAPAPAALPEAPIPAAKGAVRGSAAKRAAIVAATLDMLAESDASGITHRGIAERAGLPLAATTYHFESKLEILEAAYQHIIDAALAEAQRIYDDSLQRGDAAFERVVAEMLTFYAGRGRRNTIAQFHLALFACRTRALAGFASRAHDAEVELLRARARDSGVVLTRNLAQAVTSVVGGILLLRMLGLAPGDGGPLQISPAPRPTSE